MATAVYEFVSEIGSDLKKKNEGNKVMEKSYEVNKNSLEEGKKK